MFAISISFGPNNAMMSFLYKAEETFRTQLESINSAWDADRKVYIADDFGQHGVYAPASIHAIFDEDLKLSGGASIERGLHNMRVQIEANEIGSKDPKIAAAARNQRMSSIMAGSPNGGMPITGPWPRA